MLVGMPVFMLCKRAFLPNVYKGPGSYLKRSVKLLDNFFRDELLFSDLNKKKQPLQDCFWMICIMLMKYKYNFTVFNGLFQGKTL